MQYVHIETKNYCLFLVPCQVRQEQLLSRVCEQQDSAIQKTKTSDTSKIRIPL